MIFFNIGQFRHESFWEDRFRGRGFTEAVQHPQGTIDPGSHLAVRLRLTLQNIQDLLTLTPTTPTQPFIPRPPDEILSELHSLAISASGS